MCDSSWCGSQGRLVPQQQWYAVLHLCKVCQYDLDSCMSVESIIGSWREPLCKFREHQSSEVDNDDSNICEICFRTALRNLFQNRWCENSPLVVAWYSVCSPLRIPLHIYIINSISLDVTRSEWSPRLDKVWLANELPLHSWLPRAGL